MLITQFSHATQDKASLPQGTFTVNTKIIKELKKQLLDPSQLKKTNLDKIDKKNIRPIDLKKFMNLQGGVSDGGGNAVGKTLFDFYENENSLALSEEAILNWDGLLVQTLNGLDLMLPKSDRNSFGFGEELRNAIRAKKWILETKEISSAGCLNQSLVQSENQNIVACQNDFEVRIYAPWFLNQADQKNQVALITHEALLSWAREIDRNSTKEQLEYKIREINRQIYLNTGGPELKTILQELFSYRFYSTTDTQGSAEVDRIAKITISEFCAGRPLSQTDRLRELQRNPLLYNEVNAQVGRMQDLHRQWQVIATKKAVGTASQDEEDAWLKKRQDFCDMKAGKNPLDAISFKPEFLSPYCKKEIENSFSSHIQILQDYKDGSYVKETALILMQMNSNAAESVALSCAGLAGVEMEKKTGMTVEKGGRLMAEIKTQALKYVRTLQLQFEKDLN